MKTRNLSTPWLHAGGLYAAPRRLLFKLPLGEAPETIPTADDVRLNHCSPALSVDGGPIDRILRHFVDAPKVARLHAATSSVNRPGQRHMRYDDSEHVFGMARTFIVVAPHTFSVAELGDALRQLPRVESVTPDYLSSLPFTLPPTDHLGAAASESARTDAQVDWDEAWQTRDQIRASEAMAYEPGDSAIIIGVVDTGVASDHPELRHRLRPGYDTVDLGERDLASGLRFVGDFSQVDNDPNDGVGHGTACAGIIGAKGEQIPPGLAGECSLLPIRVLGAAQVTGRDVPIGVGAISNIDRGMVRAVQLGAKVINMSFGTPRSELAVGDPMPHEDVVRFALSRGCVLVAATGNSGKLEDYSPAVLDGVIAVGAADVSTGVMTPCAFSTSGDHVTLCAPGIRVVTSSLTGYQRATGTSFAAPFVAAAAALLLSRASRLSMPLESTDIKRLLMASARPWRDGRTQGHGAGLLDAHAALRALNDEISRSSLSGGP